MNINNSMKPRNCDHPFARNLLGAVVLYSSENPDLPAPMAEWTSLQFFNFCKWLFGECKWLSEETKTMDNKQDSNEKMEIFDKYRISHTDGTPLKGKKYFVMRLDSDDPAEAARVKAAMKAYKETTA